MYLARLSPFNAVWDEGRNMMMVLGPMIGSSVPGQIVPLQCCMGVLMIHIWPINMQGDILTGGSRS